MTSSPSALGSGLLADQVVVVTASAGTGIGFATARRAAEEGARVVLSDRSEDRLREGADRLEELCGERPLAIRCDVSVEDDVQGLFRGVMRVHGRVDVLVNNAGLGGSASIVRMSDEEWNRVLDVTLGGTFRATREALRLMCAAGGGAIVNNASVLGWRAEPGRAHYSAAKAGVMALTRVAAMESARFGVRVNAVAPSLAVHDGLSKVVSEEVLTELTAREAFGRAAQPEEIANVILFLASGYASYMTGEVIAVSCQHP